MTKVWCIRAEFGKYTDHFVLGGYVAVGWMNTADLTNVVAREELYPLYKDAYPDDTSNLVIGAQGHGDVFLLPTLLI